MLAFTVFLAQTMGCPPDVGQIRWSDFTYTFMARGQSHTVEGTLWDRDRNGKPSKGDLFRIDESERWFVLGGGLAGSFAKRFKALGGSLHATCESRFDVEGVATVTTPDRLLDLMGNHGGPVDPLQQLNNQMRGWADEVCSKNQHYEEDQLAGLLVRKAEGQKGLKNSTIQQLAREVAQAYGLKCAHLSVPRTTFE